jgi:hypothetical protein
MLMAARKLQGIGLVLFVLMFAMTLYPVSLRVAATRSELAQVEYDVMQTRLNIRYLETEFSARSSLRQLERWNAESLGYAAPEAAQFLSGERALAQLDSLRPVAGPRADRALLAVAEVPPVPASRSATQMIIDASIPSAQAREPVRPRSANVPAEPVGKKTASAIVAKAPNAPSKSAATKTAPAPSSQTSKQDRRLAMLDQQLLTPAALNAIDSAARAEAGAGRAQ